MRIINNSILEKMNNPLVSVIVPVYNNEKYIDKCIYSIIKQTYDNLQIIIINDGSTDGSYNIIKRYADKDLRILVIDQNNKGVSAARNAGLNKVKGDYLTFIDGDDYIAPDYIFNLVKCAEQTFSELVITGITMVRPDETIIKTITPGGYKRFEHEEWTFRLSAVAAHLYSTELWKRYDVRFYEGERGEDMPVSLFFSGICENISVLQKADYYYVQHKTSAMHSFKNSKNYLPYNALENAIIQLNNTGIKNSIEFHELFVIRILATMISIAKGFDSIEVRRLAEYISRIIREYYPDCYRNPYIKINSGLDVPFFQKIAVRVLINADRVGLLLPLISLMCR